MKTARAIDTTVISPADDFARSIVAGLTANRKTIESKWLYDAVGSKLFDAITMLDEYYPTRTEIEILRNRARILSEFAPPGSALVELGSGSSVKTRLLLDALPSLSVYVPVDISSGHLRRAAELLSADYPDLNVHPLAADFTGELELPPALADLPKLVFFPGSTLGNFEVTQADTLLARLRLMDNVAAFVVGADLIKDPATLVRAYDDSDGVTAAFNLNLLTRINRELGADFDLQAFRHEARWNTEHSRIEMHLVANCGQTVTIFDREIPFEEGETIHTENSHKYDLGRIDAMAARTGWRTRETWIDKQGLFCVAVLTPGRSGEMSDGARDAA